MSVTVFSWNYHIKKNLDYLCNNKTPGHCALEITGNYREIETIKKNYINSCKEYIEANKIIENYTNQPQDIDRFISKNLSENEKIQHRINDLEECVEEYCQNENSGLIRAALKNISFSTIFAYLNLIKYQKIFDKKIIFYTSQIGNETVYHMYFSVFPKSNSSEMEKNDINPNNLREINCPNHECDGKNSALIRRSEGIKYFEVINGKLSGVIISAKSLNTYKSAFSFLFKIKTTDFRKTLFDFYDESQKINKKILSNFLKNNVGYATSIKNDLSKFLKNLEKELFLCTDPNAVKILQEKIVYAKNLLKNLKNVEAKIEIFNEFAGIPPSEIVTLPSKICDGYGADENIIVAKWMEIIRRPLSLLAT
ncbi:MAG: hypothetical protein DCC88_02910 [Spirobacillus cienkowskii]|uniref:Uncharacterized protein n=1 Tax=Spirobacillus cienkowskii TaxID=495820 RepID=A0A369L0A7_9BACT|nr:MAG: hypothetical protein DCC88_02910 [Spirobacillus cienkowskii]